MIEVRITNNIEDKINEYIYKYGSTQTFIAKTMGYNSLQAFQKAMKNTSESLKIYAKFAQFLGCKLEELYSVEYIQK